MADGPQVSPEEAGISVAEAEGKLTKEQIDAQADVWNQALEGALPNLRQYQEGKEIRPYPEMLSERLFDVKGATYQLTRYDGGDRSFGSDGYRIIKVSNQPNGGRLVEEVFWGKGSDNGADSRLVYRKHGSTTKPEDLTGKSQALPKIQPIVNDLLGASNH